ncbi:MAG: ImmA/IrrE family metallo-endopeptidase [Oscillospiraceae bacterium]|nr:ImmA/IrrE family metallo-endopeptidase [Oscillospiraceae bacterium]
MNKIRVIKNEQDYEEALKLVEELISRDPDPDSTEGEQLSLLSTLIQDYETRILPEILPDPIEAIKFRMEQASLKPVDLIPYIGSRGRVSEILSGKRQITLDMVRALSEGLGIPAKVLIQKTKLEEGSEYGTWDKRLVAEMEKRGYFCGVSLERDNKNELLKDFFSSLGSLQFTVMCRKSLHYRLSLGTDKNALSAWAVQVFKKAQQVKMSNKYQHGIISSTFTRELVKMSKEENGPILAQEYLKKNGIILIIEPHFPITYLDGATILIDKDNSVIGLTLRYDRLDNFWFTLMHELAHISLHFNQDIDYFYDEIEGVKGVDIDSKELEADKMAREVLVPDNKWENSPAKLIPSPMAAQSLADELGVHIAVVAGIMRHEHKNYYYLNKIVNNFKVRQYFQ